MKKCLTSSSVSKRIRPTIKKKSIDIKSIYQSKCMLLACYKQPAHKRSNGMTVAIAAVAAPRTLNQPIGIVSGDFLQTI
jgi:hypothetical protein